MGDSLVPNGLSMAERVVDGLQGTLLQVDIPEIVADDGGEPVPSSTSVMPSRWPASTVEICCDPKKLDRLRLEFSAVTSRAL